MNRLTARFLASLLAALLVIGPAFAAPQEQQQPQQQQPPPQQQPQDKQDKPKDSKNDVDQIGNRKVGRGVNFYSLEREIAIGKQLAQDVERSAKLVDDPVVVEFVNRVGQNLVRNSDARVPFTIKVIDSDEINAFALPGGFFYVNSGLVLRADEESELAGVMAHEIAHVTARHGTKNATKGEIAQLAMIPLILLGPGGWAGYGIYQGLNFLIPLSYLKFSRDAEREADFLGLQYMYKAGYDPNSYVSFFEKIQAEERRKPGPPSLTWSRHGCGRCSPGASCRTRAPISPRCGRAPNNRTKTRRARASRPETTSRTRIGRHSSAVHNPSRETKRGDPSESPLFWFRENPFRLVRSGVLLPCA